MPVDDVENHRGPPAIEMTQLLSRKLSTWFVEERGAHCVLASELDS
jgi:hypothetical protein